MRRRFDDDVPLDEQTQDEIITDLQVEMMRKKQIYRQLFSVVMLLPSPLFLFSARMRQHSMLAFQSLACIIVATFCLYKQRSDLVRLDLVLAGLVTFQAVLRFRPFLAEDVLWFVPLVSCLTVLILEQWFQEMQSGIEGLKKRKFAVR